MGGVGLLGVPWGWRKPPDGHVITQAGGKKLAKVFSLRVSSIFLACNLSKTSHTFSPLPQLIIGSCSGHFVPMHFLSFKIDQELQAALPNPTDWACEVPQETITLREVRKPKSQ